MSPRIRISGLSDVSETMTAIDQHSMIGDPNCTNSTIATAKCACVAAAVVADALVASVGLQMDRHLEHVAILSLLLYTQCVRCFSQCVPGDGRCMCSNMSQNTRITTTLPNEDKTTGDAPTARTGLVLCSRCHLAWASESTLVGPGKDTHGTPVPTQWEGRGWPESSSTRPPQRQNQGYRGHALVTNMVA